MTWDLDLFIIPMWGLGFYISPTSKDEISLIPHDAKFLSKYAMSKLQSLCDASNLV